jgi:hypothetical protein
MARDCASFCGGARRRLAARGDRDRVDVQVVERRGCGPAGKRRVGVGDRDVVQAVPLEQDLAGRDVDLLHHAGQRHPLDRAADLGQVRGPRPVGGNQRGVLRADHELVQVHLESVARLDGGDGAVRGVGDDRLALPVALDDLPFPPGEHGLAPVALDLEIHPALTLAGREAGVRRVPDDAAAAVHDHQPGHPRAGERIARRGHDEVLRARAAAARAVVAGDGQGGRGGVGPRHEVQHAAGVVRRTGAVGRLAAAADWISSGQAYPARPARVSPPAPTTAIPPPWRISRRLRPPRLTCRTSALYGLHVHLMTWGNSQQRVQGFAEMSQSLLNAPQPPAVIARPARS